MLKSPDVKVWAFLWERSIAMTEKQMFDFLVAEGLSEYGAAVLLGHFYAESALNPRNLQNSYESKLGYTDDSYTEAVDNGSYTNFVNDAAGYGFAQWTYWSRKQALLNYAKSSGCSIGDAEMQLRFALSELQGYKAVLEALKTATEIRTASDIVLEKYENPADQSETVKQKRAGYGQAIYDRCAGKKEEVTELKTRSAMVGQAESWLGKNEADGSYKVIIDTYNSFAGTLPRNTKMLYTWPWCACFWSALAILLGYTDIIPIEISCYYLIERAKEMGIWIEEDSHVPKLGEAVLYDWQDGTNYATTDNTGTPDHVGIVTEVYESAGYMVVIEGNYSNAVKKRTLSINGRYIRGFISPKYDAEGTVQAPAQTGGKSVETVAREVIAGTWGDNPKRKEALLKAGYNYDEVRDRVNEILNGSAATPASSASTTAPATKAVTATDYAQKGPDSSLAGTYTTTANLYMRNGAGTNKKALVLIPKGTKVQCYGYYSVASNVKWLYIQVTLDGVKYTGFSSSEYLKK